MADQEEKQVITIRDMDPDIYHRAKMAALRVRQNIGAWITQAIKERLNREKEL